MKKFLIIAAVVAAAAYGAWALWGGGSEDRQAGEQGMPVPGEDGAETDVQVEAELKALGDELESSDSDADSELDSLEVQPQ